MKNLDHLLQLPNPWHGNALAEPAQGLETGFPELDELMPEHGWVRAALTELLVPREGVGALQLLLPALARLSQQRRWIAWVAPPYVPYAPALEAAGVDLSRLLRVYPRTGDNGLATVEDCLRSGTCAAVLAWPVAGELPALRRLQRAAAQGRSWGVLFRPEECTVLASPAAQRLRITRMDTGISVTRLDARGAWNAGPVELSMDRLLEPQGRVARLS